MSDSYVNQWCWRSWLKLKFQQTIVLEMCPFFNAAFSWPQLTTNERSKSATKPHLSQAATVWPHPDGQYFLAVLFQLDGKPYIVHVAVKGVQLYTFFKTKRNKLATDRFTRHVIWSFKFHTFLTKKFNNFVNLETVYQSHKVSGCWLACPIK